MERFVLFPGRHHLLTRFQAEYLHGLAGTIVWAVTSANHQNTKRNPVAYDRREAAIERFSVQEGLRSLVVPVFDTAHTDRFAEVTLKSIESGLGRRLSPDNAVVACSTPEVAELYAALGFEIAGVEADHDPAPPRPWDVLLMLASGDAAWREFAHPATLDVYDRYRLDEQVALVVNDPVVGEEGGLTTTRDYRTYAEAFEASAERKWAMVRNHVRPGRIVDVGCSAGAVLALADHEPALRESDLIGIEVARHLYEECVHRKAQVWFTNPNVYFYCRNVLGGAVFPPTRARLDRFAADFHYPLPFKADDDGHTVEMALGDAMEFLTHKDYPDNWLSEAHEQFCGLEFADWKTLLTDVGFEVDAASHAWRNDWIVEHRITPVATLSTVDGAPMDWPDTHVLLVARRPLNT